MKITHVQLTKTFHVPGHGAFARSTLTPTDGSYKAGQYGVTVTRNDVSFLIPWHMIEIAVLENEANAKATEKAA